MTNLSDAPGGLLENATEVATAADTGLGAARAVSIRFEHVGRSFKTPSGPVAALDDVHFDIFKGEVFGIIGRSGAGKSTLVRTINLLEKPDSGRVLVNGEDFSRLRERELAHARRRLGMVFQHFNLLSSHTVAQNIGLPLRIAGCARSEIEAKVTSLLALVGLSDKRDVYPARLSGGQKQRVGIARALVHDPDILLCDEATSALDPETTQSILVLLKDINRRLGLTVVLITHEMAVIREACDRVAVMEKGRVVELGEVWRVFGAPASDTTEALLRTVVHDLPDDISGRIGAQPQSPSDALLLDIRIDGHTRHDPDLAALVASLGLKSVRLVHGGIERIQGRAQGRLVVALPAETHQGVADGGIWSARLGLAADRVRPLGYLAEAAGHA
nr:ATP-binding cassette domain-containing protein [Zoogloeaceae bacterium]